MVDPFEVARCNERVRRKVMGRTPGVTIRDVAGGWVTCNAATVGEETPSMNRNRMYWLDRASPPAEGEIAETIAVARGLGMARMFYWIGPRAWSENVGVSLARQGAREWPHVRYPVIVRDAGRIGEDRATALKARVVPAGEVPGMLEAVRWWFSASGAVALRPLVEEGIAEVHGAFDGGTPVGISALVVDGDWGYLGFAVTDPAYRARGGQSALIRSRVERAAERGARWCVSETNTMAQPSLRNLERLGFAEAFRWRVYAWEGGGAP